MCEVDNPKPYRLFDSIVDLKHARCEWLEVMNDTKNDNSVKLEYIDGVFILYVNGYPVHRDWIYMITSDPYEINVENAIYRPIIENIFKFIREDIDMVRNLRNLYVETTSFNNSFGLRILDTILFNHPKDRSSALRHIARFNSKLN